MADSDRPWLIEDRVANALILRIHAVPGAKASAVAGTHGDRLKIRIAAKPVDGEANAQLCAYIARLFAVPRRAVTLISGEASRAKTLRIDAPGARPDRDWGDG